MYSTFQAFSGPPFSSCLRSVCGWEVYAFCVRAVLLSQGLNLPGVQRVLLLLKKVYADGTK